MQKFTLLLLFNLIGCFAFAQDTIPLSEIMVTATKIPIENYKTGRSIDIITNDDLRKMPVSTIDEALRYIAGMNINSRNGFGVQADIGMRGSTFSQVLVMVDNVRFNDPLTAHFNNNIPVALSEIGRIEIIRGPAAASYGSDAVGGLIHIKTKTYLNESQVSGLQTSGELGIGQHHLNSVDAGLVFHQNKWTFSTSYKSNIAEGEQLVNPNFLAGIAPDSLYHNFFDIRTYSASLAYQISDSLRVYARVGRDYRDFSAKYFYTRSAYDESVENTTNMWTQIAINYDKGKHKAELNAGYKVVDDFFEFNPLFTPNEHRTRQFFLNISDNYQLKSGSVAAGLQVLNKGIKSTDRGDHNNSSVGIYGILSQQFRENIYTNLSMRLEYDSNFGLEILPQLSLSYRKKNYILRAVYGRAVRAADFTERYVSYQIPSLAAGRNVGNPDLRAEKSNSFDLGADVFLPSSFKLSTTLFYRRSKDLIDFSLRNSNDISNLNNLQDNTDYFYADNISKSETAGIELSTERVFQISDYHIHTQLAYTYIETTADAGDLSKYIANHPKHNLSLVLDARYKNLGLAWYSTLMTRQEELAEDIGGEIPNSYFVSNLRLNYDLSNHFAIYGQAANFTNTNYQEILGAKMPEAWWSFGVRWNLVK